jgi:hypothetical protein
MKLEVKNALGQVYLTGQFNEKEGWLHNQWTGYISAEDVIEAVKRIIDTFGVNYSKMLNDNSKGEGSWEEANSWLAQNWIPKAIAGGLKKFAFVVAQDVFSAMSSEELATIIPEAGFEMRTFSELSDAEAWLRAA